MSFKEFPLYIMPYLGISDQTTKKIIEFIYLFQQNKFEFDRDTKKYFASTENVKKLFHHIQKVITRDQENIQKVKCSRPFLCLEMDEDEKYQENLHVLMNTLSFFEWEKIYKLRQLKQIERTQPEGSLKTEFGKKLGEYIKAYYKNKEVADYTTSKRSLKLENIRPAKRSLEQYLLSRLEGITFNFVKPKTPRTVSGQINPEIKGKSEIASDKQKNDFMQQLDIMYERLKIFMEDNGNTRKYSGSYKNINVVENSANARQRKKKRNGNQLQLLMIPLKDVLRRMLPGILDNNKMKYVQYPTGGIVYLIENINIVMQNLCNYEELNHIQGLVNYLIGKEKTLTYGMLYNIFGYAFRFLLPYTIDSIKDDYTEFRKMYARAEDILTKRELEQMRSCIMMEFMTLPAFVIADFIEYPGTQYLIENHKIVDVSHLFNFLVRREIYWTEAEDFLFKEFKENARYLETFET